MTWYHWLGVYVTGFILIQLLTKLSLRSEPTAHGQIVGHQIGCIVGLLWPLVPFYAVLILLPSMAITAWVDRRCGRCKRLRLRFLSTGWASCRRCGGNG